MRRDDNQNEHTMPHERPGTRVESSRVAGVGHGLFSLTRDMLRMQKRMFGYMMDQTASNMKLMAGMFDLKESQGASLYGWMLDSTAPERFRALEAMLDAFPEPQRSIMRSGTMTQKDFQALIEEPSVLEAAERFFHLLPNEGDLFKPAYNHKILAEAADGTIEAVDYDRIISLYQSAPTNGWVKPQTYPRIIFTSSHAKGESLGDVTRITHGIEALARDSWGAPLNLTTPENAAGEGQTMVLFSCETHKNPPLNGIALTRRLKEMKANIAQGREDQFHETSDGAKRIANLMLACMCENYYQDDGKGGVKPLFKVDDPRPLAEIFADGRPRITLSADAGRIAQHFQLMGYSKGGNVVSDAMRYLHAQLQATVNDRGVVRVATEDGYSIGTQRFGDYGLRRILHNINTASMAARELPFTETQKKHGLQRVAFNNIHDALTGSYEYPGSWNDEFYLIEGTRDKRGHDPEDAMGTREQSGYILNDARVSRRLKEFFAPHYGRAAIANIYFEEGNVMLEAAPGTPDATLARYRETIESAMKQAGLRDAAMVGNDGHLGLFTLQARENLYNDPVALLKLKKAFTHLRGQAEGLVVAQSIMDEDIPSRISKLQTRDGGFVGRVQATKRPELDRARS